MSSNSACLPDKWTPCKMRTTDSIGLYFVRENSVSRSGNGACSIPIPERWEIITVYTDDAIGGWHEEEEN